MNTIMVDYDLDAPGQKYQAIIQYIKGHREWANPLKSSWMIRTTKSAVQVRDDIVRLIDANDKVVVTDVTHAEMAWYGLSAEVSRWIKNTTPIHR
jgi:hypothetical protein